MALIFGIAKWFSIHLIIMKAMDCHQSLFHKCIKDSIKAYIFLYSKRGVTMETKTTGLFTTQLTAFSYYTNIFLVKNILMQMQ